MSALIRQQALVQHAPGTRTKRELMNEFLEHGPVDLVINSAHEGLRGGIGGSLFFGRAIRLRYGRQLPVPIPDLTLSPNGVYATLRKFWNQPGTPTFVPWDCVFGMVATPKTTQPRRFGYWRAALTREIVEHFIWDDRLRQSGMLEILGAPEDVMPATELRLLTDDRVENDQELIRYDQVERLTSGQADLLLRVEAAQLEGPFHRYELGRLNPKQRGIERRILSTLYDRGLIDSSCSSHNASAGLRHELDAAARQALKAKAQKEEYKRRQQAWAATRRQVSDEERVAYAEALGLSKKATPEAILKEIFALKERGGVSPRGRASREPRRAQP